MGLAGAKPDDGFFQLSLLFLVATGFAAVLTTGRLDHGTAVAAGAALVVRLLIVVGWLRIPLPERAVRALTIAYVGFYPIDLLYLSANFLHATVRLVFFVAAVKLLTARTGRDYLYLGIIAFLELMSAAMLTSSAVILAFLALFVFFAVAARTRYEIQSSGERVIHRAAAGRPSWKLAALSVVLASAITTLGLGLFFVVPRAAGAYLSRLPPTGESFLGFSDQVVLGAFGRLQKKSTPVLRVRFLEGQAVDLKWRGGALQHFDGLTWSNPRVANRVLERPRGEYIVGPSLPRRRPAPGGAPAPGPARGRRGFPAGVSQIRYRVIRAPMDSEALFLIGIPQTVEGDFSRLEMSETDSISVPGGRWKALRYEGSSLVNSTRPKELRDLEGVYPEQIRWAYLQLPELDPRIPQLARHITDGQVSPYWRAAALEHFLRTEFSYTLDLPDERPADPLADFLFRRKKGHCEYFASAMTVMLRAIGIPARLANGFQSGVYNSVSGYYTIRASDAHAWVEAYFPGFGWATFDPTPPEPQAEAALGRSWLYLDAMETFWNDWVVQYDLGRQLQLARSMQTGWYSAGYETIVRWDRSWKWAETQWEAWKQVPVRTLLVRTLPAIAVILGVAAAVWAWPRLRTLLAGRRIKRGQGSSEDCALLYRRALEQMRRRGFVRQEWQTAVEFAATVQPPGCPDSRVALLRQITLAYNQARFGHDVEAGRQLPALVRALEGPAAPNPHFSSTG